MKIKVGGMVVGLLIVIINRECFGDVRIENKTDKNLHFVISSGSIFSADKQYNVNARATGTLPNRPDYVNDGGGQQSLDYSNAVYHNSKDRDLYIESVSDTLSKYCIKSKSNDDSNIHSCY